MSDSQVVVSTDWTRNWHAKIAVKITAIFLWVVMAISFGGVIIATHNLDSRIEERLIQQADSLTHRVHDLVAKGTSGAAINEAIVAAAGQYEFAHVRVRMGEQTIEFGDTAGHYDELSRDFFWFDNTTLTLQSGSISAFHVPATELASNQRTRLLVWFTLGLLVFGLFLSLTIQQILAKPFKVLMDATAGVTSGNLDLRLDTSREDEFGHLSRFLNAMLDRIQAQQKELTHSNEELIREIAVRKQAEAELTAHRDDLEKLVKERTEDLAIAHDKALQASQAKSAFIANTSHEIRTPLTPIIGFAESMLAGNQSEAERTRSLQSIIRNGKQLLTIINDILDLSKIEAGRLDVEHIPVHIPTLLTDLDSMIAGMAKDKGLQFAIEYLSPIPDQILGDPTRLRQILTNLCSNAIKFTEHGSVRILIDCKPDRELLLFQVADTGIGMSKEQQDKLFKPFSQADSSTTRRYGGTGLGLYVSNRLAKMMKGDISIKSIDGVGSKFSLSVPTGPLEGIHFSARPVRGEEPWVSNQSRGQADTRVSGRVLLAEDSEDNQTLITLYLERIGASVNVVENGRLAVEQAMEEDHDLVLMDMQMPVMGGVEAVELLRKAGYAGPIVAMTANVMKEDQEKYLRAGCDDVLAKPIDVPQFNVVVARYLKGDPGTARDDAGAGQPAGIQPTEFQDAQLRRIAERFVQRLPDYAERLNRHLETREWDALRREAHTLKGLGSSMGYPEISGAAARLESTITEGSHDRLLAHVESVIEAMEDAQHRKAV